MAFDTFDAGVAPGGLRSKNEIKILICYLFDSVGESMSRSLTVEAIRSDELANFFEIVVAFDELVQGGSLIPDAEIDGEQTYLLSANGRIIAQQLETTLAHSVKRKAYNCALRLLGERRTARENFVDIVKTESGFEVNCRVSGGDITLLSFTLYAPDYEQAEIVKENFLGYPRTVYKTMLGLMTKNTESVGEALEEVYGTIVNP